MDSNGSDREDFGAEGNGETFEAQDSHIGFLSYDDAVREDFATIADGVIAANESNENLDVLSELVARSEDLVITITSTVAYLDIPRTITLRVKL